MHANARRSWPAALLLVAGAMFAGWLFREPTIPSRNAHVTRSAGEDSVAASVPAVREVAPPSLGDRLPSPVEEDWRRARSFLVRAFDGRELQDLTATFTIEGLDATGSHEIPIEVVPERDRRAARIHVGAWPDAYGMTVSAAGLAARTVRSEEEPRGGAWTILLNPPLAAGRVEGRISNETGDPIQGAVVRVGVPPKWHAPAGCTCQAESDADGRFAIDGLPLGEPLRVFGQAAGYLHVAAPVVPIDASGVRKDVDVVLVRARRAAVRVLSAGTDAPIPDAYLYAMDLDARNTDGDRAIGGFSVQTDANGVAHVPLPMRPFRVGVSAANHAQGEVVVPLVEDVTEVRLPPYSVIECVLIDDDGERVGRDLRREFSVTARGTAIRNGLLAQTGGMSFRIDDSSRATPGPTAREVTPSERSWSDAGDAIRIWSQRPLPFRVFALIGDVLLGSGVAMGDAGPIEIRIDRAAFERRAELRLSFEDEVGDPWVGRCALRMLSVGEVFGSASDLRRAAFMTVRTTQDGLLWLRDVPPGRTRLWVFSETERAGTLLWCEDIDFRPGRVETLGPFTVGDPGAAVLGVALEGGGTTFARHRLIRRGVGSVETALDGDEGGPLWTGEPVTVEGLLPGWYTVEVDAHGYLRNAADFQIRAGETADVGITLARGVPVPVYAEVPPDVARVCVLVLEPDTGQWIHEFALSDRRGGIFSRLVTLPPRSVTIELLVEARSVARRSVFPSPGLEVRFADVE